MLQTHAVMLLQIVDSILRVRAGDVERIRIFASLLIVAWVLWGAARQSPRFGIVRGSVLALYVALNAGFVAMINLLYPAAGTPWLIFFGLVGGAVGLPALLIYRARWR